MKGWASAERAREQEEQRSSEGQTALDMRTGQQAEQGNTTGRTEEESAFTTGTEKRTRVSDEQKQPQKEDRSDGKRNSAVCVWH